MITAFRAAGWESGAVPARPARQQAWHGYRERFQLPASEWRGCLVTRLGQYSPSFAKPSS